MRGGAEATTPPKVAGGLCRNPPPIPTGPRGPIATRPCLAIHTADTTGRAAGPRVLRSRGQGGGGSPVLTKRFLSAPSSPQNESRSLSSGLLCLPVICTASRDVAAAPQAAPPWAWPLLGFPSLYSTHRARAAVPILQVGPLRLREVRRVALSHTASQSQA